LGQPIVVVVDVVIVIVVTSNDESSVGRHHKGNHAKGWRCQYDAAQRYLHIGCTHKTRGRRRRRRRERAYLMSDAPERTARFVECRWCLFVRESEPDVYADFTVVTKSCLVNTMVLLRADDIYTLKVNPSYYTIHVC
jgi:hypothetical protein